MKKELLLETLLTHGERLDTYTSYADNTAFVSTYAKLKVPSVDEELLGEYTLFNDSNAAVYNRMHAYLLDNNGETLLFVFKNTFPYKIKYRSEGNDIDLLSRKLINGLLLSAKAVEEKYKPERNTNFFRLRVYDAYSKDDIQQDREYILNNIRKNRNGQTVCWHMYPERVTGGFIFNILEHEAPSNKLIMQVESSSGSNEDVHFVPVEKDKELWKNQMKKDI